MAFQIIAITVFIVFYGCYFVKMIRQKRKGIHNGDVFDGEEKDLQGNG